MVVERLGWDRKKQFYSIVDLLNGVISTSADPDQRERVATEAARAMVSQSDSFKATLSLETVAVYNAVLSSKFVSAKKAAEYYGQWHITPEAVATVGFVYIVKPDELAKELLERFGAPLLISSGIAKELDPDDRDTTGTGLRWMFSANYPVVEPQISPQGRCHSMQFRPSNAQKKKVLAHKAGQGKYTPQFMSLRGASPATGHLIGINLEHLKSIKPCRVDIVEGAKDVAADLSLGNEAYGLPGTGIRPPKQTVAALSKMGHTLRVCMDGDEAGIKSQDEIVAYFIDNGFPADRISKHSMPKGQDITDILVAKVTAHQTRK
jgi:hypothetical protein